MPTSSTLKELAHSLRLSGKSFREIATELNIPVSTSHLWTKHIKLSVDQEETIRRRHQEAFKRGRLIAQIINSSRARKTRCKFIAEGESSIGNITKRELLLVGVALYWGEGFKKDSRLGFANSDPEMINLFLKWLYEIHTINSQDIRLRVGLNISYFDRTDQIQHKWSEITKIPLSQFQKPFYQKSKQEKTYLHPENYLGVLRIRVNNNGLLFHKILGMIEGLKKISKTR